MWLVPDEFEIFEFEVVDIFDGRIQFQPRQWTEFAGELFARLFEMVLVKVEIAKCVNEIARHKLDGLRNHHCEERIRSDVERNTEEKIAAALVQLATQFAVLHVKLKEQVTGWQCHFRNLGRVPSAYDKAPALWVGFDFRDQVIDLIHVHAVCTSPIPPLRTINAAKLAIFVSPFIPNCDAVLVQVANVCVTAQKPKQFVDDRFDM
jgi:hypothetical protein